MDNDFYKLNEILKSKNVSRETFDGLIIYKNLLEKWNKKINLVSKNTISDIWERHILDSAQLYNFIPDGAGEIIDLGSGAGLPGIVIGILARKKIYLVESDLKKCAFLNEASARLNKYSFEIISERIENIESFKSQVICSRALASMNKLFDLAYPLIKKTELCLFLKGENVLEEIEEANKFWEFEYKLHPSLISSGKIVEVKNIKKRG